MGRLELRKAGLSPLIDPLLGFVSPDGRAFEEAIAFSLASASAVSADSMPTEGRRATDMMRGGSMVHTRCANIRLAIVSEMCRSAYDRRTMRMIRLLNAVE